LAKQVAELKTEKAIKAGIDEGVAQQKAEQDASK
jgi:hypothetical protein